MNRRSILPVFALALIACLPVAPSLAAPPQDRAAGALQGLDPVIEKKLALAEGHHDLAVLYIKKGDIEKGIAQAREIVRLHLTGEFEKPWVQSLSIICERLAEARRFDAGQALLEEAFRATEQNENRVKILRNKARLYVLAGENDKAIESWNRALDLEGPRSR